MIMLRRCTYSDMDIIYKWINDDEVRNNSFNSDYIEYETHVKWFNEKSVDKSIEPFIKEEENILNGIDEKRFQEDKEQMIKMFNYIWK